MSKPAWTDEKVMPWGQHKGRKLKDVPPDYLLWLYEQTWIKDWPELHAYLKANEDAIMAEKRDVEDDDYDMRSYDDYRNYRN